MAAYLVAFAICFSPPRWKPVLLLAVILPFWINLLIRTYALVAVFRSNGFLNYGLEYLWWLGHATFSLVGLGFVFGERFEPLQLLYNNGAVIAGLVYVYMPFMVLPLYATIERRRTEGIPQGPRDLLTLLMEARDEQTGEAMSPTSFVSGVRLNSSRR